MGGECRERERERGRTKEREREKGVKERDAHQLRPAQRLAWSPSRERPLYTEFCTTVSAVYMHLYLQACVCLCVCLKVRLFFACVRVSVCVLSMLDRYVLKSQESTAGHFGFAVLQCSSKSYLLPGQTYYKKNLFLN